jgi:hypothetical protein
MTTEVWREALTDTEHNLHRAAWLIFGEQVSVGTARDTIEADGTQEVTIPLLKEILDDDYLYDTNAPGSGKAPVTAIYLLGDWKVKETLSSLLEVLEDSAATDNDELHEAALTALRGFGSDIVDDVLAWANKNEDVSIEACEVLSAIGEGNQQAFDFIAHWIEQADEDIEFYVSGLITVDAGQAAEYLAEAAKNNHFDKDTRKLLRKSARDAEKIYKEQLERKIAEAKAEEAAAEIEAEDQEAGDADAEPDVDEATEEGSAESE